MRALLLWLMLLLGGCASMEATLSPEIRYGQLYALENALRLAASNCNDAEASFTASYWAITTIGNIAEHSDYLAKESIERVTSRQLVSQLYRLQYAAGDNAERCQHFAVAGNTTRELLAALNR